MIKSSRFSFLAWFAALLCASGFLIWMNLVRVRHIEDVSALGGWSERTTPALTTAAMPTPELAAGNGLIVPEHRSESFHWIAQTQRMFNRGEWRVRHIDYENAPFGRAVFATSPYRWWLGLVAWCDHFVSGRSPAQSVERAALVADPLLHFFLLVGTTLLVAWRFGSFPAALISVGLVTVFPFAAEFLPGAPDDRGLAHVFVIGSVLFLLAGIRATNTPGESGKSTRRWFFFAGVAGGFGLWLSVAGQFPILLGVGAGALLAAWVTGNHRPTSAAGAIILPWRVWAAGGAITTLIAYLIEFAPAHLGDWRLATIHPVYGVAWLGAGEMLVQTTEWIQSKKISRALRNLTRLALAILAIAALPVAMWKNHDLGFLGADFHSFQLTKLPESVVAQNLGTWISRDGPTLPVFATLLPLLLIAPAVWLLIRRQTDGASRASVALALGPVLVALGFACTQLVWWNEVDGLLLVMLVAATGNFQSTTQSRAVRVAWSGLVLLLLLPGVFQIAPRAQSKSDLSRAEVLGLVERDLAGWLALHAGPQGAVILAPPNETTALCYYGGMRGIGSLSWENKEGVAAAMRILSSSTAQEAKELVDRRGITHIVVLSWDTYFDEYARAGTGQIEGTFRQQLRSWDLPPWLRPVPYQLPTIAGFEGQSATIYEVVEDQDEATASGRMTEYFIEMGDAEKAAAMSQALRRFPGDIGAWVARAEVELARGDEVEFSKSLKFLQARLSTKTAPVIPWEQRVRLAVILAKAKQVKIAREQVAICLASADERNLRGLSTGSLYRLLVLSRAFEVTFDSRLREFALGLLPSEQRERLK